MGIARYGGKQYTVALAETPRERASIHTLRELEYAGTQPYLLAPTHGERHRAADVYDDRSYVFGCWSSGERYPVATCRFTKPLFGRYELDDLAPGWTAPPVPKPQLVETSRVVVRRDHRATGLVEAMLVLAGSYMLAETPYRYNFAVCMRALVRLYARLGMKLTSDEELDLRGRPGGKHYVVIYGDMAAAQPPVLTSLAHHGWDITLDYTEQGVGT